MPFSKDSLNFFRFLFCILAALWYSVRYINLFFREIASLAKGEPFAFMKKDVIISICGLQQSENDAADPITLVTAGRYYRRNGHYYISYEESELTGMAGTKTTLKVDGDTVRVIRTGLYPSELLFEQGKQNMSLYHTDFGDLSVVVSTQQIQNTLTDEGGDLDVRYAVEIAGGAVGVNHLRLNIRTNEQPSAVQQNQ